MRLTLVNPLAIAMAITLPLSAQGDVKNAERRILEIEHTRAEDASALETIAGNNARLQRLAVRALGRLERPELAPMVGQFLVSDDALVRQEAASALGQMQARLDYPILTRAEQSGAVRGEFYVSAGRIVPAMPDVETFLRNGLSDASTEGKIGAVRGLESLFRLNRNMRPAPQTIEALKTSFNALSGAVPRQLILLTLNQQLARDTTLFDASLYDAALRDTSAQVRRLAVAGSRKWIVDVSPMVRYQALRTANNCQRAEELLNDPSGMVKLAAVDMMGDRKCDAAKLSTVVSQAKAPEWRTTAHGVVALAKVNPNANTKRLITQLAKSTVWQARVYAATAARIVGDSVTLAALARDTASNVAIEAMNTPTDAIRALGSKHSGLLMAAANKLKGSPALAGAIPQLLATLDRVTKTGRATTRDERTALMARIGEAGDAAAIEKLRPYLSDVDPAIAKQAATIISQKTGQTVQPVTTKLANVPLPAQSFIDGLSGATATITMKGLGVITLQLLMDDAPITAAMFADLADKGKFNGLTFHRIVPNFVIQGGSPGADEYDGITEQFMKEEVGLPSHLRGTLGISTRGHDTGDGQIFVNLIDNYRLDHQYTVFARIISGMDVADKVQEGDVLESVKIVRKR